MLGNVKLKYTIIAGPETYWSCFAFDGITPDELHCTHKFFGEQTEESAAEILQVLNAWFQDNPFEDLTPVFEREEFFGKDREVRVLTQKNPSDSSKFLLELRKQLDAFAEDNYPGYKPHVTTDLPKVDKPLTRYCFCRGNEILAEYPSNGIDLKH